MSSDRQYLRDSSSEGRAPHAPTETTSQVGTGQSAWLHVDSSRIRPAGSRSWTKSSMWLHIASVVISAVYIIIAGTTQLHKYGYTVIGLFCIIGVAPQSIAFLFSLSELVARRMRPSGWHFGVHIGLSLILWLAGLAFGIFLTVAWTSFSDYIFDGYWEDGCPEYDYMSGECWGVIMLPQLMVELILMYLSAAVHFVLFCGAIHMLKNQKAERKAAAGTV